MPENLRQIRPVVTAIMLASLGATLAACSGGDFGRTRADMRSDDMHRWLGAEVTSSIGLKHPNSSSRTRSASFATSPIP